MIFRKANDRGRSELSWLKSRHSFSFAEYYDPHHMGFGHLRVINDDWIAADSGFGTHPHRDMEIISYVLEGALTHQDSMGTGSTIKPGDVQRMSAGTGVTHSEFNHSKTDPVHLLQIWFIPDRQGHEPGYEQKSFSDAEKRGRFRLVASAEGRDGSVSLNQDVDMSVALLDADESITYDVRGGRDVWVHIARGSAIVNDQPVETGDGISLSEPTTLHFSQGEDAEIVIFDMQTRT